MYSKNAIVMYLLFTSVSLSKVLPSLSHVYDSSTDIFASLQTFPEIRNSLSPNDVRGGILLFLGFFDNGVAQRSLIVTATSRAPAWKFLLQDGSDIES